MDTDGYRAILAALLPPGAAWPQEQPTNLHQLLAAWADELARVDARVAAMLEEADPRTTAELLTDWERAYALPDTCFDADGLTEAQRRAQVVGLVTARGGQSRSYFIGIAQALGHTATITEYRPYTCGSSVDAPLYDEPWAHTWCMNLTDIPRVPATVDSTVSAPLASWSEAAEVRCMLDRLAPAQTISLIHYGD